MENEMGAEKVSLETIEPGMTVYGVDGETLGAVESVNADGIGLLTHTVPSAAIARVDEQGVHLHIAHAAFTAASPETRESAPPTDEQGG